MSRENLKLLIVATVCLAAGWTGPAVAAVTFAQNSDKVDGKHAVGAGATTTQRKGKLVATSPTTGRLPNNIVAVAPDAARLGAVPAANMRVLGLAPASFFMVGNASNGGFGPFLPASGGFDFSGFRTTFLIPPGHRTGAALKVDVAVYSGALCEFRASLAGTMDGFTSTATAPYAQTSGYYHLPAANGHRLLTFTLASPDVAHPLKAGQVVELEFIRPEVGGTCTSLEIPGVQVRY